VTDESCDLVEKKNNLRKALPYIIVVLVIALVGALIILGSPSSTRTLYPSEVRSYQGENLSAIAEVQPNNIKGIQHINQTTYRLNITGLVDRNLSLTYDEVLSYPSYQKVVTLYCVEGWDATILWQGVLVKDLLAQAGVRGNASAVIFTASDGFTTALPLNYLTSKNILLAYKMNNVTIPPERGFPFQLVAESQYGYKWIKWVTQIEVSDNAAYLGYWESRGFPNNASIG
jgi:DMSO/TMAO reductase YedYZ molybdopterin-dependent catalytic subunit